jgi:serine/threonine protein kinase
MHSQHITHRNLCPSSILLNDSLQTVIAGFSSMDCPKLSMRVGLKCEWLIRPPEIIMQPKFSFGPAGDIWQFGCLVVFMLRHKMPF